PLGRERRALRWPASMLDPQTPPSCLQVSLRRQQGLLADVEPLAGLGSVEWIPGESVIHCSDGLYRLLGLEPGRRYLTSESFLGRFVHPDDRERLAVVERLPPEQWPTVLAFRIVRTDGQVRHVQGRAWLVRDEQGKLLRVLGLVQDMTDHKQAEAQQG